MTQEIIHLRTKSNFHLKNRFNESQIIIGKFIEACKKLDVSIFEPYMDEDKDVFEDKDKYRFLKKLHDMFEHYCKETFDDFEIDHITTICNGCSQGKRVEQFKVYNVETARTIGEFGYVIEVEEELLKDIYMCLSYDGIKRFYR